MSGQEYSYYPGCSLHSSAKEYNDSIRAVFCALDIALYELEDWNCCGASSGHSMSAPLALTLTGRNLKIAQDSGLDVIMPCAACFNRHKTTEYVLQEDGEQRARLEAAVGFSYSGRIASRALLDVLANDIGLETLKGRVRKPLAGLKVVSYYGCLLVRPVQVTGLENPEAPSLMDSILDTLGAEVKTWSYATECCGGGLALTKPDIAGRMANRLLERAQEAGAAALVTSCPLCQLNLEMRQKGRHKMPLFYISELIGLAFDLSGTGKWWQKHLIDPQVLLKPLELV